MTKEAGCGVMTKICGVCGGKKDLNQIVCEDCHNE